MQPIETRAFRQWHTIVKNRSFLRFTLFSAAYGSCSISSIYPYRHLFQSQHQTAGLLGSVFTITALIGVVLQLPASQWVQRSLGMPRAIGLGFSVDGVQLSDDELACSLAGDGNHHAGGAVFARFDSLLSAVFCPFAALCPIRANGQLIRLLCQLWRVCRVTESNLVIEACSALPVLVPPV